MGIYRCAECGAVNRIATPALRQVCSRCRRVLDMSGRPQPVDAAALVSAILSSPAPVLVDFSPGRQPSVALAGVARDRAGEIVVLRVNPGEEPAAAEAYAIRMTPTLVLFSGGAEVARRAGVPEPADIRAWMDAARTVPALR